MATEEWRRVWREGFARVLPTAGLEALRDALRADDPRLTQGSTTTPPPLMCVRDWPVEAACALGYCGAVEHGGFWTDAAGAKNPHAATVRVVEEFFSRACYDADQLLGEPAACRWFLNAYDDWPRQEMLRNLLPEVEYALAQRGIGSATDPLDAGANGVGEPTGFPVGGEAKVVPVQET